MAFGCSHPFGGHCVESWNRPVYSVWFVSKFGNQPNAPIMNRFMHEWMPRPVCFFNFSFPLSFFLRKFIEAFVIFDTVQWCTLSVLYVVCPQFPVCEWKKKQRHAIDHCRRFSFWFKSEHFDMRGPLPSNRRSGWTVRTALGIHTKHIVAKRNRQISFQRDGFILQHGVYF